MPSPETSTADQSQITAKSPILIGDGLFTAEAVVGAA